MKVHGSILVRYNAALGPLGVFGYPETDEMDWFDAIARASVFQNGAIRWDPVGGVDVEMDKLAFYQRQAYYRMEALLDVPLAQSQAHILREEKYPPLKSWCGYTLAYAFKVAGMDPVHATPQFAGLRLLLRHVDLR